MEQLSPEGSENFNIESPDSPYDPLDSLVDSPEEFPVDDGDEIIITPESGDSFRVVEVKLTVQNVKRVIVKFIKETPDGREVTTQRVC